MQSYSDILRVGCQHANWAGHSSAHNRQGVVTEVLYLLNLVIFEFFFFLSGACVYNLKNICGRNILCMYFFFKQSRETYVCIFFETKLVDCTPRWSP